MAQTFGELIETLRAADDGVGIHLTDRRFREHFYSWSRIVARTDHIAAGFQAQGVRCGDNVLIAMSAQIDLICAFLALARLGAVAVSVSPPLMGQDRDVHRRRIVELITGHRIGRLIDSDSLAGIAGCFDEVPASAALRIDTPGDDTPAGEARPEVPIADPDDTVFVQFSSGTTSRPKGVRITHRNLLYNIRLIAENDGRTPQSVWVSWLPLNHDMGLVGGLLSNMVEANRLVLMDPLCFITRPLSWLGAVSRYRGTTTAIPNFALDICSTRISDDELQQADLDLGSFRYIYNGAEPVRPDSIHRFEERFGPFGFVPGSIYPVYGMSETTLIVSAPARDDSVVRRDIEGMDVPAVGYPLGDFQVRIVGEDGEELRAGTIGEIRIRGTSVTPGYRVADGDAPIELPGGWLATGDLGMLDEEGRLYITGRKGDLIIHQGRNFYGHDIAGRVESLPAVRKGKTCVFGIDLDGQERVVVMAAQPRTGIDTEDLDREIRRFVLREFGLPIHDVCFVPNIPKTTSGKIVTPVCRKMYLESRP